MAHCQYDTRPVDRVTRHLGGQELWLDDSPAPCGDSDPLHTRSFRSLGTGAPFRSRADDSVSSDDRRGLVVHVART